MTMNEYWNNHGDLGIPHLNKPPNGSLSKLVGIYKWLKTLVAKSSGLSRL